MTTNKLHVTEGNMKIGRIPSVSLPPWTTCDPDAPCRELCYARKAYVGYAKNTAGAAWDDNLAYYRSDPTGYFDAIITNLMHRRKWGAATGYFRWHVGGDIPDPAYYEGMRKVARLLPGWKFLCYTRRSYAWSTQRGYDRESDRDPENLTVVRSLWLNDPASVKQNPWFKVVPVGTKVPAGTMCPGECEKCMRCWSLKPGEGMHVELH